MLEGVWGTADGVLYENGDYQLWVADGADAAFALWPRSMYYSRNDGQWHYGPNPLYSVYRVEGDNVSDGNGCDFYVVTGSASGFSPTTNNERNTSASNECPPVVGANCLWLGEVPTSTVVPAQSSINPTMLFTATPDVGVNQPGDYYCDLQLQGNPVVTVRVTMTVLPLSDMGQVHGYVLDNCTGEPVEADIFIPAGVPITQTKSDKDTGYYSVWLISGTYGMTFTAAGYVDYGTTVQVVGGGEVVLDVNLVPNRACIAVSPPSFEVWVLTGTQRIELQNLANRGGQDLNYTYQEKPGGYISTTLLNPIVPATGTTGPIEGWHESDTPPPDLYATRPAGIIPETWGEGTPIPTGAQYQGASATIDNENFYLFGGYTSVYLNQCLHYNTSSGAWTTCTNMPTARGNIHAYYDFDGGKIYVPGGYTGAYRNENEAYDPDQNSWSILAPMPIAKSGYDGCIVNGKMYLFGGNGGAAYNETQIYDIAMDSWSTGTPMPITTHRYGDAVTYEGKCYVIGGWGETTFLRYDPQNNSWQSGPPLTVPRNSPNCTVTPDGIIYCWGGGDQWTARNNGEYYDLNNWPGGSWTQINTDPIPYGTIRAGHACASDRLWIEGGAPYPYHNHNQWWEGLGMTCYWPAVVDVPWVWEDPVTGTVPAGGAFDVDIGFTSYYTAPPTMTVVHLPLGTYTATLRIKNNDAVAGTPDVPVTMHIVAEFIAPDASFLSNAPVCLGEEVIFTNTTIPGVPPKTTYLWDFGDGITSTLEHPTHLYGAAGLYTVTLTACNSENMCSAYVEPVEVLPLPESSFTYAVDELTVAFTNTSQNATAYLWSFGDGITSTLENPVHTYAVEGSYVVTLWATGDCGTDEFSATVVVGTAPVAGFESNSPVCLGETMVFTNTTSGTQPITYLWDFGDGITSTLENPTHVYASAGTYTAVLTATNAQGSDSVSHDVVIRAALAGANFTWTPITPTVGQAVTFTGTVEAGSEPLTYEWAFGDGEAGSGQVVQHTYAATGTYTVLLTVTNACGTATARYDIVVQPAGPTWRAIYLPLVFKGYTS